MASRLLASVMATPAGVAKYLSTSPHALSSRHALKRPPIKSLVPVMSLIPKKHTPKCLASFLSDASRGSWTYLQPVRCIGDLSSRRQRSISTKRNSSGKYTSYSEEVYPSSCHFTQTQGYNCMCGRECHSSPKRGESASAGIAACIGPVDICRSCNTFSSVSVGGSIAAACASLLHQQQRHQFFSSAARTTREQRQVPVLPTPPPIFGCTGRSSSYQAVATPVGNDTEAAAATSMDSQNVLQVTSMDFYESCVYEKSHTRPLVCCFVTRGSLQCKLLLHPFKELAASTRSASSSSTEASTNPLFLLIDCDDVPRAAYHARVEHVPSVVVMKKDDGFREIISDPAAEKTAAQIIQETKQALERLQQQEQELPGGVQQGPSRYTKNIGVDNLNVYRVGWISP